MGKMNKSLKIGISLMLLCTFFAAAGQLFFKYASKDFSLILTNLLTNYYLILGFFFYAFGALLLIIALKFGELSVLYPFESINFVWVTFLSFWFLGEKLNHFKIWAVVFIIFGVVLIARGSKDGK